jgi:hypothetical protein
VSDGARAALEVAAVAGQRFELDLLQRLARCAERAGELREAVRLWEGLAREIGRSDPLRFGQAKRNLAGVHRLLGSRERAAAARAAAADAFAEAGAFVDAVEVRLLLGWDCEYLAGDEVFDVLDAAERNLRRLLDGCRDWDDPC